MGINPSRCAYRCTLVVIVALFVVSQATAHPDGVSIPINFGADEPEGANTAVVSGAAGVLQTETWNNLTLLAGGPLEVNSDDQGAAVASGVMVTWASNNTWASTGRTEENNTAPPGDDRELMTGYLDTNADAPLQVDITGLENLVDDGDEYAVYVYMNGGVLGRGGDYVIGAQTFTVVDNAPFDGTYNLGEDYVVFEGVTGTEFTLTATPTTGGTRRSPVNAIEIVLPDIGDGKVPRRTITKAVDADTCPPDGRGPLTVSIKQEIPEGATPGDTVAVTERVTGPITVADVTAQNGGTVSEVVDIGVDISWSLTRQELQDTGVSYEIDILSGEVSFSGTVNDEKILGRSSATLFCDDRVTNVACENNVSGGVDVTWENHPLADSAVAISIQVDGQEVGTVPGTATSATVDAGDLSAGYNQVCVVNSGGFPACCTVLANALSLGDLVGGGDGTGTADPLNKGINAVTGMFEIGYLHANNAPDPATNPQEVVDSPYIDVVLVPTMEIMPINSELVEHVFDPGDIFASTWGHILNDATHDEDKGTLAIWAGGRSDWLSCVAIHGAGGITFDLAALGDDHGTLDKFVCFAGADQCGTATVSLHAILSDDGDIIDVVSVNDPNGDGTGVTANTGEPMELTLGDAQFLTLVVGAFDSETGCDHGVFANAVITLGEGTGGGPEFKRGDVNADGSVNIADAIALLGHLFASDPDPTCFSAADANDDGQVNIADAIAILGHLFGGDGPLLAPFPGCGEDPTEDAQTCESYLLCP